MFQQLPLDRFRSTLIKQIGERIFAGLRQTTVSESPDETEAWDIEEWRFPHAASVRDQLLFLVRYAILAPSVLNRQPWKFQVLENRLLLHVDTNRSLPAFDPDRRELIMSCGAALFHIRTAMTHFGFTPRVRTFPSMNDPNVLADIRFGAPTVPSSWDESLFMAIRKRRTHRKPFSDQPVDQVTRDGLVAAAAAEDSALTILTADRQAALAKLIGDSQDRLSSDEAYHREVNASAIPAVGSVESGEPTVQPASAEDPATAALQAPILAVLSTTTDTVPSWLTAGQALDRVLLTAREFGLFASVMNQPLHFADSRRAVAQIAGQPVAQMILRIGYGSEPQATTRLTADDVRAGADDDEPQG